MDTIGEEKRVVQYASTPNLASTPTNYRVNADRKVSKPFQNKGKLAGVSADVQQHSRYAYRMCIGYILTYIGGKNERTALEF